MEYETDVCIAGAGPAGMVLGLLLAKAGLKVIVLEHHDDFTREYRGEVLMPRFSQMFTALGLGSWLEQQPHLKLSMLEGLKHETPFLRIQFKEICAEFPYALWIPQTLLLNALLGLAQKQPSFQILFKTRVEELIQEQGSVHGVIAQSHNDKVRIRAKVTVAADGRFSILRKKIHAQLCLQEHPFDLVWFSLPKPAQYDQCVRFYLNKPLSHLILPKYLDLIQCGIVIQRHAMPEIMRRGISAFKQQLAASNPLLRDHAESLTDFSGFHVLQAKIELVNKWARAGFLLVGDSAHTCSPAGAVGVSVAVESAIDAAGVILDSFAKNDFSEAALGALQRKREKDVRRILKIQKQFSGLLINASPQTAALLSFILPWLARVNILQAAQRELMTLPRPLQPHPAVVFSA